MQSYLIGAVVALALFAGTFYTGRLYERNLQAMVTVEVLQNDAKEVAKIETVAKEREVKIVTQTKVIHEKAPEWSATRLPDAVLDELRNAGIPTQSDVAGAGANSTVAVRDK